MTTEIATQFTCPYCNRPADRPIIGICTSCEANTSSMLGQIVNYRRVAETMIQPGRTGSGFTPTERSIGLNVTSLSYSLNLGYSAKTDADELLDRDGLGMLHEWERLIRDERNLTPVALVPYAGNTDNETRAVVRFLLVHLPWVAEQPWAAEMVAEVSEVHRAGMVACRSVPVRQGRIACPGDDPETGDICGAIIHLPDDFHDYVKQPDQTQPSKTLYCRNCLTTWTLERLARVAIEIHGITRIASAFGKDTIARCLGQTERHVNRLIAGDKQKEISA